MYALDESIFNVDISIERLVIIDHPPSFDQQPFILQGRGTEREGGERGRGTRGVEFNPDILIYCTITYVIRDFIAIL